MAEKIVGEESKTIGFEVFIRTVAIILEENNKLRESGIQEEKSDEEYEVN